MSNKILEAADFAYKSHIGQTRKWSGTPYIRHPARVAAHTTLVTFADSNGEDAVCAAWLHDVVEDCGVQLSQVRSLFGPSVDCLVWELTNPSKQFAHLNRDDKKAMDREHLSRVSYTAKCIKLIDRIDNLLESVDAADEWKRQYARESRLLVDAIGHDVHLSLSTELLGVYCKLEASCLH